MSRINSLKHIAKIKQQKLVEAVTTLSRYEQIFGKYMKLEERKSFASLRDSKKQVNFASKVLKDIHNYALSKQEEVDKCLQDANVGVNESGPLKIQSVYQSLTYDPSTRFH